VSDLMVHLCFRMAIALSFFGAKPSRMGQVTNIAAGLPALGQIRLRMHLHRSY